MPWFCLKCHQPPLARMMSAICRNDRAFRPLMHYLEMPLILQPCPLPPAPYVKMVPHLIWLDSQMQAAFQLLFVDDFWRFIWYTYIWELSAYSLMPFLSVQGHLFLICSKLSRILMIFQASADVWFDALSQRLSFFSWPSNAKCLQAWFPYHRASTAIYAHDRWVGSIEVSRRYSTPLGWPLRLILRRWMPKKKPRYLKRRQKCEHIDYARRWGDGFSRDYKVAAHLHSDSFSHRSY